MNNIKARVEGPSGLVLPLHGGRRTSGISLPIMTGQMSFVCSETACLSKIDTSQEESKACSGLVSPSLEGRTGESGGHSLISGFGM